jgi:hypothetical protein
MTAELTALMICAAYAIGWFHGSTHEMKYHSAWLKKHLKTMPKLPEEL